MPASRSSSILVGFQALQVNPLRTMLSTLGVIIGVASMVSVLAMGDGVEKYARDAVARTTDLQAVSVTPIPFQRIDGIFVPRPDAIHFALVDVDSIRAAVPEVESIQLSQNGSTTAQRDSAAKPRGLNVRGVLASAATAQKLTLSAGAFFTESDVREGKHMVVLDGPAADTLAVGAGGASLLGKEVLLGAVPFTVVGILKSTDTSDAAIPGPFGGVRLQAYLPFGTLSALRGDGFGGRGGGPFGGGGGNMTLVSRKVESVDAMVRQTQRYFARRYGQSWKERVNITANSARVEQLTQALLVFKLLMGAITSVTLLVGGIGIMNVLLASVAERTREIGIRKAAGARNRDILTQFLAEAVAITGAGAALGVLLGLGIAFLAAAIMRNQTEAPVHAAITASTVLVAALASVLVGVTFGLYPALRASRLSPIDSIRHE
jgi:putative ABC transport system permease protein